MKPIFYDTDVLSCFLSIHDVTLLKKLFDKIIIPYEVFKELKRAPYIFSDVLKLINENFLEVWDDDVGSETHKLFLSLHYGYEFDPIGKGEAAAIALAVINNGILASNNTKDVSKAVKKFKIKRIKTGDIFVKAFEEGLISENQANDLWKKMISKNRYLTANSFSEYLKNNPKSSF